MKRARIALEGFGGTSLLPTAHCNDELCPSSVGSDGGILYSFHSHPKSTHRNEPAGSSCGRGSSLFIKFPHDAVAVVIECLSLNDSAQVGHVSRGARDVVHTYLRTANYLLINPKAARTLPAAIAALRYLADLTFPSTGG